MHVGAVVTLDGPPPDREEFLESLRSRLHLVPRYRQKLKSPRFEMGRPFWIDDPRFNLEYHVRFTALPAPGRRTSCASSPAESSRSASTARSRCGSCGWCRVSTTVGSRS